MKQWVQKFIEQLDYGFAGQSTRAKTEVEVSADRATLLYVIDIFNKHLIELDAHPVRKVREILDEFAKELVNADQTTADKVLFRFRHFFSAYRVDEYAYVKKAFEDFKGIIWDFVDQLAEDVNLEQAEDTEVAQSLKHLREAVEAESIDILRSKSREFIDCYVEKQTKKNQRRDRRMKGIKKNLDFVKKQLNDANNSARRDQLTQAYNRRSFDETLKQQASLFALDKHPVSMIVLDIDFFKKINDTYGHDIGDFVLKECVRLLKELFPRENDFVARIGGEEFAIVLPDYAIEHAVKKAEDALARIRKEVFVTQNMELRFTVSMGIAQLLEGETVDQWLKRADTALYASKHGGRNRSTVATLVAVSNVA